ncbi:MAG: ribbon-helix-helix protein, CopG family [Trueperaceae bacterium]|nr:ribbon-helix-helix protein, CopG family [Trueperaceae bacterium]
MVRKQFHLTPEQCKAIKQAAKRTGASESEIVRRALDAVLLYRSHGKPESRERFDRSQLYEERLDKLLAAVRHG